MGGVNDRVKEFLRSWQHEASIGNEICCECGVEIKDGNFALVSGRLYCLLCREEIGNAPD